MGFIKCINTLVVNRVGVGIRWPPTGYTTWRGLGMPSSARHFFVKGLTYRARMFVATSESFNTAEGFAQLTSSLDKPATIFKIHHCQDLRCKHVNFIDKSGVVGEAEYLFAPYSTFRVEEAPRWTGHYWLIEIYAYPDNKDDACPENAQVALYH